MMMMVADSLSQEQSFRTMKERLCCKRTQKAEDVNIGGMLFPAAFAAMSRCPTLMSVAKRGRDGVWFIDRNGDAYEYILPFLMEGRLVKQPMDQIARALLVREAEFLGLTELITILTSHVGAPVPANEEARLRRLRKFMRSLVKNPDFERLDHITRIVATIHESRTALLSFIDSKVHVCISRVGFEHAARPRYYSFCAHTLLAVHSGHISPLVVKDARQDGRFQNNPLVVGEPHVRSYSGSPLVTSDGFRLGALCTMDDKPRQLSRFQLQVLANFSYVAMLELERDQLVQRTSSSAVTDGTPYTTVAALRIVRMQQAATQLIALVYVGGQSPVDYRLLYTNSIWSSTVGVTLTPPSDLRDLAEAVGPGVPWCANREPDSGPLLWHWLRLDGVTEDDFDARLREQWEHGSSTSNMIIKGSLRSAPGLPRQRVVGRMVRATVPLDASIAVDAEVARGALPESPGSLHSRLAFVLLHPDGMH
eukprot:TRINITY_DN6571_c0_g1_i3.p1 TRINITY_DN6571_c0_g1~~TRINITY_DN6571_c0_g1_i3.p1  ORF type:complete len:500 (+),score=53.82 TRINITY_DN6571_c0_g1_i3:64-1500(+)